MVIGGNMGQSPHECPPNPPRRKRRLCSDRSKSTRGPKFPIETSRTSDRQTSVINDNPILPFPYGGHPWQEYLPFAITFNQFRLCYGMTNPPGHAVTVCNF